MNLKGVKAALAAFRQAQGGDVVSEEVLQARSNVCKGCPLNRRITSWNIVSVASKAAATYANRHGVPAEVKDRYCKVCGCGLALLLPSKVLHPDTPSQAAKRPPHCWVPKEAD